MGEGCSSAKTKVYFIQVFNFFLSKHVSFLPAVFEAWNSSIFGSNTYILCKKLKSLKPILKTLNKTHYNRIHERVSKAKDDLLVLQNALLTSPNADLIASEQSAAKLLPNLLYAEESLLKQKSIIKRSVKGIKIPKFSI